MPVFPRVGRQPGTLIRPGPRSGLHWKERGNPGQMKIFNLLQDRDPRVVGLGPKKTVLDAVKLMVEVRCGSVLVTDSGGGILGIFTERDLMVRVVSADKDPRTTLLEEVMTRELYTTDVGRKVAEVRREMREKHIRHVPVLQDGSVVAVLSTRDLLRADFEEKREHARAMDAYIRGVL
jgi:CBS domain-containing protein